MKISIGLSVLSDRIYSGVGKYTYYITKYLYKYLSNLENIEFEGLFFLKTIDINIFFQELYKNKKRKTTQLLINLLKRNFYLRKLALYFTDFFSSFVHTDLYFEPNFVPLNYKAKKIVSFVHDVSFFYSDFHPLYRLERMGYGFLKKTLKSDIILVPSNFIKNEICDKFPWITDRVKVIYHGIDHRIFKPLNTNFSERKYILFVGNIEPRKNLVNLLKAYSFLPDDYKQTHPLLIVSRIGWKNKDVFNFISEKKLWDYIIIENNIHKDEELASIYRKSLLLIYPSIYEGFGFPPLEAMACGCPVLVSNKASLPEICGNNAIYIDPYNVGDIFEKLITLLDKRSILETISRKALQHVKKFSWDKTAKEHANIFLGLLNYKL